MDLLKYVGFGVIGGIVASFLGKAIGPHATALLFLALLIGVLVFA